MRQVLNLAQQVARQQNGGTFICQRSDEGTHGQSDIGVEPIGRLIQQEQSGGAEQGAGNMQALLHAAGKLLDGPCRCVGEFYAG